jgi:hypothetical protein
MSRPTFEVDRDGLAKLLERRGKSWAVLELIQNSWDEDVSEVQVTLEPVPGRPVCRLVVEDDDPEGFVDLRHSYTLFAESEKKADATRRGRFNLGEKLVIAVCDTAEIVTTTGAVRFDASGRRHLRRRRDRGSRFEGMIRMTRAEYEDACRAVETLLAPDGVRTVFNGSELQPRVPLREFTVTLPTEISDADGVLRPTERKTAVRVFEPQAGEVPSLYELGIPVVETADRWHVDIGQKVPLNVDRDNVTPAYLSKVRALVLNAMHDQVDEDAAAESWVAQALEDRHVSDDAVRAVVRGRFGDGAVVHDPSDLEGTKIAMSQGRTVIPPRAFSGRAWDAVRRSGAALPAGQVTPSPRPYSDDPDAPVRTAYPQDRWTDGMRQVVGYAQMLGRELLAAEVSVELIADMAVPAAATYGKVNASHGRLEFNVSRLGRDWFTLDNPDVDRLIIHEFGHHRSGDHFSADYHRALCELGAALKRLALEKPELFTAAAVTATPQAV